jgi:hypothetical protein
MAQWDPNQLTRLAATPAVQGDEAARAASRIQRQLRDPVGRVPRDSQQYQELLRKRVDELVGITFYGTLLKTMRTSVLKGSYGHGGRGEDVFGGQLDILLAQRAGHARRFQLNDAICRRLSKNVGDGARTQATAAAATRTEPS